MRPRQVFAAGSPVHEILKVCQELQTDLLIVGAGHEGKVEFIGSGSVAHQLKGLVPHSILTARGPPTDGAVLCGVDGSEPSHIAARVALGVAQALGSELVVLHARPLRGPVELPKPSKRKPWEHRPMVRFESLSGSAGSAIVERGQQLRANLTVLGSRGLGGAAGWGLGSVSDHASSHATGSVLIVKT